MQICWRPSIPVNAAEQGVALRLTRIGESYVFLREAGGTLLDAPSLKAARDIGWDDPVAQTAALLAAVIALRRVLTQDLDPDMRHGRKSRPRPFTGYKRHVIKTPGPDLVLSATARPANQLEVSVLARAVTRRRCCRCADCR